jgi:hypothetical protein
LEKAVARQLQRLVRRQPTKLEDVVEVAEHELLGSEAIVVLLVSRTGGAVGGLGDCDEAIGASWRRGKSISMFASSALFSGISSNEIIERLRYCRLTDGR